MIIHDSFALPVEGTETRVNASMQGTFFTITQFFQTLGMFLDEMSAHAGNIFHRTKNQVRRLSVGGRVI